MQKNTFNLNYKNKATNQTKMKGGFNTLK